MADVTPGPSNSSGNNKNQAPTGIEVRDPDALQTGMIDVWGWIEHNAKAFLALIVVGLLIGIGAVVMNWMSGRQEKKAQEAFYAVESRYTTLKEGFDRAKFKAIAPPPAPGEPKTNDVAATGDLAKDYNTIPADLERVAKDHPKTSAGAQAALLAAELYINYKQPEKAVEIAQVPVKGLGDKSLLGNLARITWGNALATKGDCAEAVKVWQPVLDSKAVQYLHGDVGLRSGLCYESMNDLDKAKQSYQKVVSEGAESAAGTTAKGFLRALEAKAKTPAAAPTDKKG